MVITEDFSTIQLGQNEDQWQVKSVLYFSQKKTDLGVTLEGTKMMDR